MDTSYTASSDQVPWNPSTRVFPADSSSGATVHALPGSWSSAISGVPCAGSNEPRLREDSSPYANQTRPPATARVCGSVFSPVPYRAAAVEPVVSMATTASAPGRAA